MKLWNVFGNYTLCCIWNQPQCHKDGTSCELWIFKQKRSRHKILPQAMGGRTKARVKTPSPDRPLKPIKDGENGKGYLGIEGVTADYKKQVRNNKTSRNIVY